MVDGIIGDNEVLNAEVISETPILTIEEAISTVDEEGTGITKYTGLQAMMADYEREFAALVPDDLVIKTDEEKAEVRDIRIKINAANNDNKETLRDIKRKLVADIDEAIKVYNDEVAPMFDKYYQNAATAIANYDQTKIDEHTTILVTFFHELLLDTGINFVEFNQIGVNVTASKSLTSLRKEVEDKTSTIITNFKSIQMMQDKDRILEYYKQDLNLDNAIAKVQNENEIADRLAKQKIEDERRKAEAQHQAEIEQARQEAMREVEAKVRAEVHAEMAQGTQEATPDIVGPIGTTGAYGIDTPSGIEPTIANTGNQLNRYRFDVLATSVDLKEVLEILKTKHIGVATEIIEEPAKIEDLFEV